jgi:hypothetical protein
VRDMDNEELSLLSSQPPSLPLPPIQTLFQTTVLFDGKALFNDAKFYASAAFDFDAFTSKELSAVVKYTNKRGYSYHKVGSNATIEADRVKAVMCDLDDVDSWANVESIIDNYGQQKRKNLHVIVTINYI